MSPLPLLQSWLTGAEQPNRRLMVWAVILLCGGVLVYLAVTGDAALRLRIANIAGEVLTWVVVGYILAKTAPATVTAAKAPAASQLPGAPPVAPAVPPAAPTPPAAPPPPAAPSPLSSASSKPAP